MLFDADPNIYLLNFTTGGTIDTWGGRNFLRPLLADLVSVPIRAVTLLLADDPADKRALREALAFLVSPAAAALRAPIVLALLRSLGLPLAAAVTLCLLDTVSFSTRLFASIPESYMLSGTVLAMLLWLGARTARGARHTGAGAWLLAAFVTGALATPNLVVVAIVMALARWHVRPGWRVLAVPAAIVIAAFALIASAYTLTSRFHPHAPPFHPLASEHLSDAWKPGLVKPLWDFPRAVANAFMPASAGVREKDHEENRHAELLTLERGYPGVADWDPRTVLVLLAIGLGIAGRRWLPEGAKPMHSAALAVIALSAVLHAFFGRELVLYSQQWHAAALVLLAGLLCLPGRAGAIARWGLPAFVLAVAVNNALFFRDAAARLTLP